MKKTRQAFLVALTTSLTTTGFAEEPSPIIVTATRTAQTADESLASVTVITKEQIEQQQPNDIRDLLSSIRGIDISNSGGLGKTTSVFMRGTSSTHLLVLVDGVKIGSATLGTISIQDIPVSQIERIEIVRGPRAALYGSEAIGGVIQIFTRKGKNNFSANYEAGYGSYNSSKLNAGISGRKNNTSYSLNASYFNTDGFDALNDTEYDKDGYINNSIAFNLSHEISKTSQLGLKFLHAYGHNEFDSSSQNNTDFVQQTTGLNYNFAAKNNWKMKVSASQSQDKSDNFLNSLFKSRFNTIRNNASWQNDLNLNSNHLVTFGIDYQDDKIVSSETFDKTNRDNTAGFIQHQWTENSNDVLFAIRSDKNQAFGTHETGSIAFGHQFNDNLRLITSYGTGFKAPTFNNLYYPGYGDPTIKPEFSDSYEIELRGKNKNINWGINLYQNNITNLIVYPEPTYIITNLSKASISGLEFNMKLNILGWDTKLELSLLDPRDTDTDKILTRRTKQSLRLDFDKKSGSWNNGVTIIAQGHRYNDAENNVRLPAYGIINLRSQYAITKRLTLKGKIENLLDAEYETALNYNNPGLGIYVSLSYQGL